MRLIRSFIFFSTVFIVSSISSLSFANLLSDLTDGHHVLLMRHADAPGYGDPKGYTLNNCASQRNLGESGKKQAHVLGQWLRTQGITTAKVYSSPWCRCLDTAKLINQGPVMVAQGLGSFFDDMSLEPKYTRNLEKLIKESLQSKPNTPHILVTHHVNIQAYTGIAPNVGDMLLVKVDQHGKYLSHELFPSP